MSCDVGEAMEVLENDFWRRWSDGKDWRISCDVGEVTERLENEHAHSPTFLSQPIIQPFRRFTYVTAHSPTLPLLHLRHSSFSNPPFAFPTSQALHLRHLASLPSFNTKLNWNFESLFFFFQILEYAILKLSNFDNTGWGERRMIGISGILT